MNEMSDKYCRHKDEDDNIWTEAAFEKTIPEGPLQFFSTTLREKRIPVNDWNQ